MKVKQIRTYIIELNEKELGDLRYTLNLVTKSGVDLELPKKLLKEILFYYEEK